MVTIPSYEDPILVKTLDKLFAKARHPERITVAVGMQYKEKPHGWSQNRKNQDIKYIIYDIKNRPGVNRIRRQLLRFFKHDYLLMVDSHSDFDSGWDENIIKHYKDLQSEYGPKMILSKPCTDMVGDLSDRDDMFYKEGVTWYLQDQGSLWSDLFPSVGPRILPDGRSSYWTGYICCHFMFTNKSWVTEVGISEVTHAYCEEPLLSYSSYAAGWDVYSIPGYNHVAHLDRAYNLARYGTEFVERKDKNFGGDDSPEVKDMVNNYILYGNGDSFVKPLPDRMPESFFELIGLPEALPVLRNRFKT